MLTRLSVAIYLSTSRSRSRSRMRFWMNAPKLITHPALCGKLIVELCECGSETLQKINVKELDPNALSMNIDKICNARDSFDV
jgi:hypothetical protein